MEESFVPQEEFSAVYMFMIEGKKKPLILNIQNEELNLYYGQEDNADIIAKFTPAVMEEILEGRMTFQRAFMTGIMTAKGNFKTLKMLDQIFLFG